MMRGFLLFFAVVLAAGSAFAQPAMTQAQFIDAYNQRLARDGQDRVLGCKQNDTGEYVCRFDDRVFLTMRDEKGDATGSTGETSSPTSMIVNVDKGVVESIYLKGDRSSPADLIHFTAHLESLLHVLGPQESDYVIEQDTLSLGLLRGDRDATIGQERELSASFALVKCLNQPFGISGGIGCGIKPRNAHA